MAIELKSVSFKYPNGFVAIEDVSLTIHEGERVAIVGQNGAGKTTLVKMMNGLYKPFKGDVLIDGDNTREKSTAVTARKVGYVFQNPDDQIFNKTVREEIEYMPRYFKLNEAEVEKRLNYALDLARIRPFLETNPYDLPYPTRKFVAIAAVIATKPKYIILDEPTAGQDKHGIETLENMIKRLEEDQVATLTITHDMEFAVRNFKRIIAMAHKNVLLEGTAQEVFWNEDVISQARIKKPVIGEIAKSLNCKGNILFCDELVDSL